MPTECHPGRVRGHSHTKNLFLPRRIGGRFQSDSGGQPYENRVEIDHCNDEETKPTRNAKLVWKHRPRLRFDPTATQPEDDSGREMKKNIPTKVAEVVGQGERVIQHHPTVEDSLQCAEADDRTIFRRRLSGPEETKTPCEEQDCEHSFIRDVVWFPTAGSGNPIKARRGEREQHPVNAHRGGQERLRWARGRRFHRVKLSALRGAGLDAERRVRSGGYKPS